jgi:hypothetical protein
MCFKLINWYKILLQLRGESLMKIGKRGNLPKKSLCSLCQIGRKAFFEFANGGEFQNKRFFDIVGGNFQNFEKNFI